MANRVFQSVIYQMKDAIDRVVGVVDETGAVISCSELNLIGEVREGFMAERLTAGDRFVRDGYTYQQFSSAKHNDYAVFVEGADETSLPLDSRPLLAFTRHLPRPGESFLVGEPLAKPETLRGLPRPPLQGEVALRSNDGEVVQSGYCHYRPRL